jgi:threonine aldolase
MRGQKETGDREALKAGCDRFLSGHRPRRTGRAWLEELAASPVADLPPDRYGEGEAIAALETRVADLLGKEAGLFVIKGTIAQQCALHVHCDLRRSNGVVLHSKSHIDLDEDDAYERLHGLVGIRIGEDDAPFTASDLEALPELPLGVVVVELPLRRAGFKLVPWDELVAISDWCRGRGVPLHVDGARLWEAGAFYGREYAEIAALADSVYVSFYKGIGGLAGCVLAGERHFLDAVETWKSRQGGTVYTSFPLVIAATEGLARHLPRMGSYRQRAGELAHALAALPDVRIDPDPPHTNGFRLYLLGTCEALSEANLAIAASEHVWLFDRIEPAGVPGYAVIEVQIGDAAEDLANDEVVSLVAELVHIASALTDGLSQPRGEGLEAEPQP